MNLQTIATNGISVGRSNIKCVARISANNPLLHCIPNTPSASNIIGSTQSFILHRCFGNFRLVVFGRKINSFDFVLDVQPGQH